MSRRKRGRGTQLQSAVTLAALAMPALVRAAAAASAAPDPSLGTVLISASQDPQQQVAGVTKLTQSVVDTPQSISTVSAQTLADQGLTNLNDALRMVPGISLGAGETSWQGNNLYLRGFTTRDDMFVDGQRDYGYYYRDPFDTEAVEVLKGPSSILFGRGSAGGSINQVSKLPTLTGGFLGNLSVDSADLRRVTTDWDTPIAALGSGAAFRLNAMAEHSQVADRDIAETDRWGVAPSLALGLGTPTRFWLSYLYQKSEDVPDYGIPWFNGRPAPVSRDNFYGFASDYLDTTVNLITARAEHDFSSAVTLSSQLRFSHDTRQFRTSEAVVPAGTPASTPADDITTSRNEFQGFSTDTFVQDQTDLVARFRTGPVEHALVSGFEVGRESPRPTYIFDVGVPGTNLADPLPQQFSATQSYTRLSAHTVARTAAVYALDTLQIGEHWQVMGGIRWDTFEAHYTSTGYSPAGAAIAATNVDHVDQGASYRGAVVYQIDKNASVYASVGTSFDPSAEGIESLISSGRSVAQANLNLDPEKNRAYEIGTKWALLDEHLLATGAVFRLQKLNARVPDPTIPGFDTLGGDEQVTGAETELTGKITRAWDVHASYTYLASKVIRTTPGGPLLGAPLTTTPRNSSTLWIEYHAPMPLTLGLGALQTSSRLGQDTAAQYEVAPGYVIFSAMGRYAFTGHQNLQLNLSNLTDHDYMDQLHPFHVVPGAGFTAQLTYSVRY